MSEAERPEREATLHLHLVPIHLHPVHAYPLCGTQLNGQTDSIRNVYKIFRQVKYLNSEEET